MSPALAIAGREYRALFRVPVGWVTIALFLLLTGIVFALTILVPGQPASLERFFAVSGWLLLPVAPAVSMRLFSEEYRSGTIESLATAPVGDGAVVAGKFLGGAAFLLTLLGPTLVYVLILVPGAEPAPDPGPIVAGYLCLVLVGLLFLSIGLVASALTGSQTLAFLSTLFVLLGLLLVSSLTGGVLPESASRVVRWASITPRIADFARGVVDTRHVVFFLAWTFWFLVMARVVVRSRRWR